MNRNNFVSDERIGRVFREKFKAFLILRLTCKFDNWILNYFCSFLDKKPNVKTKYFWILISGNQIYSIHTASHSLIHCQLFPYKILFVTQIHWMNRSSFNTTFRWIQVVLNDLDGYFCFKNAFVFSSLSLKTELSVKELFMPQNTQFWSK